MKTSLEAVGVALALTVLSACPSFSQTIYNQSTTNNFATGTNLVEQSATTLTTATFRSDVAVGWTNDAGGVFDLPTAVATGTTIFRGAYGKDITKRMQMTSSVSMQNSAANGNTIYPISNPNVTTPSANQSDYNLTLGLFDPASGLPLPNETITEIGFVILSRTSANWPLDLLVTVTFTDNSTQSAKTNILAGRGVDDTFFGFTAPAGLGITNVRFQSFVPNTTTPVADRISWDDFGFVTGPFNVLAQPQIINVSPAAYAIVNPTNVIQFNALTYASVTPSNISLVLNSNDVTSQAVFSGSPTNYLVTYSGLVPNQTYTMSISVSNASGVATLTQTFYTLTNSTVLYDSGGFTDDTLYPDGDLLNVTNNQAYWLPNTNEPAQIIDIGPPQNKVLERQNTGATRVDSLFFPAFSSGVLTMDFDAFASINTGRTIDIGLLPTVGSTFASLVAWGTNSGQFSYFDNTNWQPIAALPAATWQHFTIINYLSGPAGGTFDVLINGTPATLKTRWRNATVGTAFNQFRVESVNTSPIFEYGQIDNLVVTVSPENNSSFLPPTIVNVQPINFAVRKPSDGVQFNVLSQLPITATNVQLLLNSNDVSSQLAGSGAGTNLLVSFTNLVPNQIYSMQITASNGSGSVSYTNSFYCYTNDFTLYDSGGFTDDTLYPLGSLTAVTNGLGYWVPAVTPAQIVNYGDPIYEKVLERAQVGTDQIDNLKFSPIATGVITYTFDARVSDPVSRTLDFSLENDGATMSSLLVMATNAVNYVLPGGALVPGPTLDTNWHHYSVVNYLSGSTSNAYDLYFDGALVVSGMGWRSTALTAAVTPLDQLRVGAIRGTTNSFGDVDNLVITAGPERVSVLRVKLVSPARSGANFSFSFTSQSGINYAAQYTSDLRGNNWTTLQTIPGDGNLKTITHTNAPTPAFYRVKAQ